MSDSTVDGSIEIEVGMNVDDAEKELARLKKKVIETESTLAIKKTGKNALVEQIKAAGKELEEFREKAFHAEGIGESGSFYTPEDAKTLGEMMQKLGEMRGNLETQNKDIEKTDALLASTKQRYGEIAKEKGPQIAFKKLGDGIKSVLSRIGKVSAVAGKAFLAIGKKIVSAVKNLNVFSKISKSFSGSLKKLGTMVKQAFVFTVVSKGLGMIREKMGAYLMANTSFTEALSKVKGALLTAFQPIYDAVVPALTTMLNVITRVINAFSQFSASLFGTTAKQAQNNAKALNNQAKATEKSGEAAEKASKSMAGFDEINQLSDNKSSGGGGASDIEAATAFETEFEETPPYATWGEAFSAFLDKILDGMPKLDEAFATAATGINNFSVKLLEMFTFPGVNDKVAAIGTQLATSLNGLIDKIDWNTMGRAIGAGLNLALTGAVSFLTTFDWVNLGTQIANFLNGAISEIDWSNMGTLLCAGFGIAIEMLAGFLIGLNIPEITQAASDLAYGFFNGINETFEAIDWDKLGEKVGGLFNAALAFIQTAVETLDWVGIATDIADFLNSTMETIDWAGIGTTIGDAFHGALDFLITFVTTFDWAGLGQDVMDMLASIDWFGILADLGTLVGEAICAALDLIASVLFNGDLLDIGIDIIKGVLQGIWNVIATIGTWLYENVFKPFIDGFKELFGIHSPSTVMEEQGDFIMEGLLGGIKDKIGAVVDTFKGLWNKIKEVFGNIVGWFKDKFSAAWQAVKDVFSEGGEVFSGIKDGILDGLKSVINTLITGINTVISIPFKGINTALRKIKGIDILGVKPFDWIQEISIPQIPKLAQGAVIPPNREFMAVLGDQKHGTNIEAPAELIRSIVREEVIRAGSQNGDIKIVFEGDLAALARLLNPHIEREQHRVGPNFVNAGYRME